MKLDLVARLPQGTPVFEVVPGYKNCMCPGYYHARRFDGRIVCPGCKRLCEIEYAVQAAPGDHIIVRKREKQ